MANPADSSVQNLLPVQAYFDVHDNFQTFIGQGKPFYATVNPIQSGLHITNSTIDSTTIGATTPSTGNFTNISTVTGTILTSPTIDTNIANKAYVDSVAQGLSFKAPVRATTTGNITLSGLQTVDGVSLVAGNRVLVKNQIAGADNGIYVVSSGAWVRSADANTWDEIVSAYLFVEEGTVWGGSSWVDTNQRGGTLGVTPITFVQFSNNATYTAGTGLTLTGFQFSITNTGAVSGTYGNSARTITQTVNAQGQITNIFDQPIAIANTQVSGLGTMSTQNANNVAITGGSIAGTPISGSTVGGSTITASTQFSGPATGLTGTASGLSIGGNAATVTNGVYTTDVGTVTNTMLAGSIANNKLVNSTITINGTPIALGGSVTTTGGTVTSVSGTGTVSGISLSGTVTSSGSLTLGGSLDLSAPPAIGGTTPNAITGTNIIATAGLYAKTVFSGTFTDGIIVDYASPVGQFTVGASDSFAWRNGGTSPTTLMTLSTSGVIGTASWGGALIGLGFGGTNANLSANAGGVVYSTTTAMAISTAGSVGQFLQSNGTSAPTWATPVSYASVTDDTTTNGVRYPLFANQTTGNLSTEYTSSTKLQYNPSTGVFTSTSFSGAGTGLTGTATSLSIGGNAATATSATSATTATNIAGGANGSVPYQTGSGATTFLAASTNGYIMTLAGGVPTWAAAPATGVTISDDTSSATAYYPLFARVTTGTASTEYVSSTKLNYTPSTGTLATSFVSTSNTFAFKNRLIDAGFIINQRSYVSGTALSAGTYAHDRWKAGASGCTYTFTPGSLGVPIQITITAGSLQQVIEGCNVPEGGTFVLSWTGTAQARFNGGSYGASPLAITGLTAGANLTIEFNTGTVSFPQVELGTVKTSFDYRPFGTEFSLCQRYFQQSGSGFSGMEETATNFSMAFPFVMPMRASPTATLVTTSISTRIPNGGADRTITGCSLNTYTSSNLGGWFYFNNTGGNVTGRFIQGRDGGSIVNLSAEL